MHTQPRYIFIGVSFAILWSSASVAGKFGLMSSEPLTLFTVRFLLAGVLLLLFALLRSQRCRPEKKEWPQLVIFGLFNTALYLGIFIIALREVAAGITALALALNPLLISLLSSLWLRRPVSVREWLSIALGMVGVAVATFPLLESGFATVFGICLLILSMLMYSLGAVYYSSVSWTLSRTVINGWQVLIAGILLLPLMLVLEGDATTYDVRFWLSTAWLVIPVSIGAVQLWLYLLKEDAVHASLWLFLCPIFGLFFSVILLDEPFSIATIIGTIIVLVSLYLGQSSRKPTIEVSSKVD